MQKTSGFYPFLNNLINNWKPRAKAIKLNLKDLAVLAGISPQHLTKIVTGRIKNPRLKNIDSIESALKFQEEKRGG